MAGQRLADGAKLSDVGAQHVREATYTRRLEACLRAYEEWIREQQAVR